MPVYKSKNATKDGRCWFFTVSFKDNDKYKQYKSKKFATRKEALASEREYLSKHSANVRDLTFNQIIDKYEEEQQTTNKLSSIRVKQPLLGFVRENLGSVYITELNSLQYERYLKKITDTDLSAVTKNKYIRIVKSLINFAFRRYGITNTVVNRYPALKEKDALGIDYFTLEEFNQFISAVDDRIFSALFSILFYCGLRIGEANALTWDDIDFEKNTISVNKSMMTKIILNGSYLVQPPKTKSSTRIIPMPVQVQKALNPIRHLTNRNKLLNRFIFALPETTITKRKNKYCDIANVKRIRLHDFRHSCASLLINHGANITLVSQYLGHSTISMTLDIYSHFYKSKMDELIDSLDGLGTL